MSNRIQLFQSIYSLYSLACNEINCHINEPGVADAYRVLRGLYVQYDTFKETIAPKIEKKIIELCNKYDSLLNDDDTNFTVSALFQIITDNLKNNAAAVSNIAKLSPLESIHLSKDGIAKAKRILYNIKIIVTSKK